MERGGYAPGEPPAPGSVISTATRVPGRGARSAVVGWVVVGVGLLTLLGAAWGGGSAPVPLGPRPPVPVPADNPLPPAKVDEAGGSRACVGRGSPLHLV